MVKRWGAKKLVYIAVFILSLVFGSLFISGQAHADALDNILKKGEAKIGYILWPPQVVKDPKTGKLSGYGIDEVEYILGVIKVKPVYVETTWAGFTAGLQAGKFDISIGLTFATIPRSTAVAFTRPLEYMGSSAAVRKGDTRFKVMEDIDKKGVKVAVAQGTIEHEYVKENFKNAQITVIASEDLTLPLVEASTGRADVGLSDAYRVKEYAKTHPEVIDLFAKNPFAFTAASWSVRKEDIQLLNFLNTAIQYMQTTGKDVAFEKKNGYEGLHAKIVFE